jgi:hypothetical protein
VWCGPAGRLTRLAARAGRGGKADASSFARCFSRRTRSPPAAIRDRTAGYWRPASGSSGVSRQSRRTTARPAEGRELPAPLLRSCRDGHDGERLPKVVVAFEYRYRRDGSGGQICACSTALVAGSRLRLPKRAASHPSRSIRSALGIIADDNRETLFRFRRSLSIEFRSGG